MAELVRDPVCKMEVDPATAAARSEYQGQTYYFCAAGCKQTFDAEPAKYLSGAAQPMAPAAASQPRRWWEFWRS
ncbi:MAG: YHS domain-containing protein [Chloroflexi bacterium]|nr:YHS domain-containing protein [Chloroflexota bacterium]